jgi:hypothetical protein
MDTRRATEARRRTRQYVEERTERNAADMPGSARRRKPVEMRVRPPKLCIDLSQRTPA